MTTPRNYEWDYERTGRTAFAMAGPAGTGNKCPPGLTKLVSPVSGAILSTSTARLYMKDPLTGTKLKLQGGKAVSAYQPGDMEYNDLNFSNKFYVDTEMSLLVQSIRRTNYINKNTNEK
eukprot:CAMPEP_0117691460 /NCGR_PEP_ID=MMETSP0804-20121206/25734_1 /TAXON_ID=1074897 /ORGANISM="Tetraselmis astigmatica, Strain CCMP880" /LENGTH=118 /DNA_ID=CAMNT_0005504699 /DNA_START=22 /DNA_END=378 /DNA_ORIENTATION=-